MLWARRPGVDVANATGWDAFFNGPGFLSWSRGQGQADVGGVDAFRNGSADVRGVPDAVLDALVDNVTFCASTDDLGGKIEKLEAFADAGLGAISLRLYADPAASIRLLGERVMPALRQR